MKYSLYDYIFVAFMIIFMLLLVAYSLAYDEASAQDLRVVHVQPMPGQPGITFEQAQDLVADVKYRYQYEARRYFRIAQFISINEISSNLSLSTRQERLNDYRNWASRTFGKKSRVVFIVPPVVESGQWWITGVSNQGCSNTGVLYIAAMESNINRQPRGLESRQGLMHEIGHTLGAGHDSGIMDSNIAAIHSPVTFSSKTIGQFYKCKQ